MEKRKRRLGDRYDGRKIRSLPPMNYISPYIMKTRNDSQNLFQARVDYGVIYDYSREKREEGLANFGLMHTLIAAYVRMVSQRPAVNRFIAGQKIYQRNDIVLSMMVKKEMKLNAQETAIKVHFSPADTIYDIHRKMEEAVEIARKQGDTTNLDFVARTLFKLPSLILRGFIGLMQGLDYFGLMPKLINRASPFHASLFVSNLGSLGIPPIFHHLYNFGNIPVFVTFGAKYGEYELNADGNVEQKKYVNYTIVSDERITDGHYLASAFKYLDSILKHPSVLDAPPETVVEDVL